MTEQIIRYIGTIQKSPMQGTHKNVMISRGTIVNIVAAYFVKIGLILVANMSGNTQAFILQHTPLGLWGARLLLDRQRSASHKCVWSSPCFYKGTS